MKIEFQEYSKNTEYPDPGDVVNFSGYSGIINIVAHIGGGQYALIDLADGVQMWDTKETIKELMDQTERHWVIFKNAKVITDRYDGS